MAKIAVTGASGFIGRHAVKALAARGHEVIAVGRSAPAGLNLTCVKTDLLDQSNKAWLEAHRPSRLLHLAWYAEHGQFWSSPLNAAWCEATVRLARDFCENGGESLVMAGTCAEYDWSYGYCREDLTPLRPRTLYGMAKDDARKKAEAVCGRHGVAFSWGRIFLPFGPGEDRNRLVPSVIESLLGRRAPFPINLGHWRDFLPAEAVAEAFAFLIEQDARGVFNICSGRPLELKELVLKLAHILDRDAGPLLKAAGTEAEFPRLLVGDNSALSRAGWEFGEEAADYFPSYARYIADPTGH